MGLCDRATGTGGWMREPTAVLIVVSRGQDQISGSCCTRLSPTPVQHTDKV